MISWESQKFGLKNFLSWLNFGSIFDSIGSKFKSQNYSTRPDSTVNDLFGSWLEQFPTRFTPTYSQAGSMEKIEAVDLAKNNFIN